MIAVVSGRERDPEQIRSVAEGAVEELRAHHAKVIAVVANRVQPDDLATVREDLASAFPGIVIGSLPAYKLLAAPTVGDQFTPPSPT